MTFKKMVQAGDFAVLGEFHPPKGADFSNLLKNANQVRGRTAAIIVPDLPVAVLKASALGACAFLQQHGLETVLQICPRDRNRLALQADILSAGALGVQNLIAVPGEEITSGDHHQAREVLDLDLTMLLEVVGGLAGGKDMAGHTLNSSPRFFLGSEIKTGVDDRQLQGQLQDLEKKIQLGVEYIVTGPVFDLRRFKEIFKRIDTARVAVIATIMVLKSAGMARYVNRNVRDISIPSEMIKRLEKGPDRQRAGLKIAAELMTQLKEMGLAGAVVSTRGWDDKLPLILDEAGL